MASCKYGTSSVAIEDPDTEDIEMEDVISVSSGEAPATAVSQAMSALAKCQSERADGIASAATRKSEACTFVIEATRDVSWRPV